MSLFNSEFIGRFTSLCNVEETGTNGARKAISEDGRTAYTVKLKGWCEQEYKRGGGRKAVKL